MRSEQNNVGSQPEWHLSRLALQSPGMTEGYRWSLEGERGRARVGPPDTAETADLEGGPLALNCPQLSMPGLGSRSIGGPSLPPSPRLPSPPSTCPTSWASAGVWQHPSFLLPLSVLPRTALETLGHEWPCMNSTSISTNTMTRWAAPGTLRGAEEMHVRGTVAL